MDGLTADVGFWVLFVLGWVLGLVLGLGFWVLGNLGGVGFVGGLFEWGLCLYLV